MIASVIWFGGAMKNYDGLKIDSVIAGARTERHWAHVQGDTEVGVGQPHLEAVAESLGDGKGKVHAGAERVSGSKSFGSVQISKKFR